MLFVVGLVGLAPASWGQCTGTLDQFMNATAGGSSGMPFTEQKGQTFTVGIGGTLARIDIDVLKSSVLETESLVLDVRPTIERFLDGAFRRVPPDWHYGSDRAGNLILEHGP